MVTNSSYSKPFTQEPLTYKTNIYLYESTDNQNISGKMSVCFQHCSWRRPPQFIPTVSSCGLHSYSTLYLLWDECVHQQQFHSNELAGVSEQRWEVEVLIEYCGKSRKFLLLYVLFSLIFPSILFFSFLCSVSVNCGAVCHLP